MSDGVNAFTVGPSLLWGWPTGSWGPSPPSSGPPWLSPTRFKQLLLTQADKFSLAEVRIPGSLDTTLLPTPSQGPQPTGRWGSLAAPPPLWA